MLVSTSNFTPRWTNIYVLSIGWLQSRKLFSCMVLRPSERAGPALYRRVGRNVRHSNHPSAQEVVPLVQLDGWLALSKPMKEDELETPFGWVLTSLGFPSLDAIACTDQHIITIQVTVALEHDASQLASTSSRSSYLQSFKRVARGSMSFSPIMRPMQKNRAIKRLSFSLRRGSLFTLLSLTSLTLG